LGDLPLVIHERLGNWARQLRSRLSGWPIRLVESRSAADLEAALTGIACPIVVLDLAQRPRPGLDDLSRVAEVAPRALVLVLDPEAREGVAPLARELGATHVLSGVVTPPAVANLIARWIPLALRRTESEGWSRAREPETGPDAWNWLAPALVADRPGSSRTARP
jgi:hypothetical protein